MYGFWSCPVILLSTRVKMQPHCFGEEAFDGLNIAEVTGVRFSLLPLANASANYTKVIRSVPVKIVFNPGQNTEILRPGMWVEPTVITK